MLQSAVLKNIMVEFPNIPCGVSRGQQRECELRCLVHEYEERFFERECAHRLSSGNPNTIGVQ